MAADKVVHKAARAEERLHVWDADLSVHVSLCGVRDPQTAISIAAVEAVHNDSRICPACLKQLRSGRTSAACAGSFRA
jgi:hypothetical protein